MRGPSAERVLGNRRNSAEEGAGIMRSLLGVAKSAAYATMSAWIEGEVVSQAAMDRSPVFAARRGARASVRRRAVRAARPAGAAPDPRSRCSARPYSFVNPPQEAPHEFYFNVLPEGPLSPRLAALDARRRRCGCWSAPTDFSACGEIPAADALWCLATGTGLGPFLSILRTAEPWEKFERVVLVHAVRYARGPVVRRGDRRDRARPQRPLHVSCRS